MKRSVRILAAILLLSTLFCTLPISVFAEQFSSLDNNSSISNIDDPCDDHDHSTMADLPDSISSSSSLDMGDINWEASDDEDTYDSDDETTDDTSNTGEMLVGTGIAGDINADGVVNNIDAILLYHFVSKENVSVDSDSLDVDGNGVVDHEDVVALFRYVSGWTEISIGYGYGWALQCAHETEYVPAVSASCANDGNVEYWHCQLCGLSFSDINCVNVISDANIVISAYSQHKFDNWSVISAPSCTEKGFKQHKCTNCEYNEIVEIDVIEHTVDEYYTEKDPTCTESGVQVGICSICENQIELEIPALGHETGDPIDTAGEMCLDRAVGTISCVKCGEVLSTYGHYYETTIVDATCTTDGEIRKECSRCHDVETTVIAHIGHVEGFLTTVEEATCTETGSMAIGCLYCDYIFADTVYETPILEHDYIISETEKLYLLSCKNCLHSYTTEKEDISVYKITFVSPHGEAVDDLFVQESVKVTLPLLSADGYTFCGWFIDQSLEMPFDEEYIESDLTLYAKWESQGNITSDNIILSNMPEDFSFTIKANGFTELTDIDNFLLVIDAKNNIFAVKADNIGEGLFRITPCELYQKGELYKVSLRGDTEFSEYDGEELWFTIKEDNANSISVHPNVVQINNADIFAITEGDEDSWYFMLYDDILDVNNYFVVYDGDINNIIHSGKVYEEGTFDKYYIYRIDELTDEEIPKVFVDIDIHYEGVAELGDFIPDENIVENAEREFLQSELYRQIETAATTFAHLSGDGKYYYDHHYPKVTTSFKRDGSKIIFTFTVDVVFGRLDTDTYEVKDLYTVTFKIKNETTFNVEADAQSINRYEFIFTPVNKTTVGLYAKAGGKVVNDERLSFFKEVFIKAKDAGETDRLDNIAAEYQKETTLGIIPLFVIPGVSINVEVYNVFSFEAIGEIGLEVITQIEPSIGIANYGNGVKVIKNFKYDMSVNAYARAKIQVSDRLGAKVEVSLIGMIHASAGIEVGPYAEAGGLLNVIVEWGTENPLNFGATSGGYAEVGVDIEAYVSLKITTLIFKIKLYQNRWNIFNKSYVLFSIGNKEMPIKFETSEEPITKKADLLYPINLLDSIGTKVIYQNLKTMSTSKKQVSVGYEIVDQPEYATLSKKGVLILNEKVGDRTYVDLKIKVTYKTLFKIVDVRIYIEHDYADEFTCHDRTCLYCGYVCKATTPHVYSEWEAVSEGVCSPNPYSMRICFDCRTCEFSGIDSGDAQHHDYRLVPGESVEPTCTNDGYLTYRCARENCQSETQIAVIKSHGSHDLIWIDGGDTHYQHCRRVGCGYNSESSEHISNTSVGCLNDQICQYCAHIIKSALGHDYKTINAKEATCTEFGYYNYLECSRCGDKVGYTEMPALNHSYTVQWKWNGFTSVVAVATCANGHGETYTVVPTSSISISPSCTAPGQRLYTASIKVDGVLYKDSITETLLPLEHNIINIASKEPTCTAEGWYDYEICTRCTHTTKVVREKLPHIGGTATCTTRAICDVCHNAYGEKLRHNYGTQYIADANGHYHVCICGNKDEVVKHTPDKASATEDESVICIVCAYVIEPATGHINHNYSILCYDDTHHWYQCNQCSEIDTKVSHNGGVATCKEQARCDVCQKEYGGYGAHDDELRHNAEMHWSYCSVCHRVTEKENHHGGVATCTKQAECVDCNELYGEKVAHDFASQWFYDADNHYHVCACGEIEDISQHTPNRSMPTETEPVRCSVCECILIPATGHINHDYSILQHNDTTHWYKCSGCDLKINEISHNGGSTTCTERAACAVCGQHYGEEPDHKYVLESNDSAHWYACELCDFQGVILEHEGGYSTCITKAVCDVCGVEYGDYREHNYEYDYNDLKHWQYCSVCKLVEEAYNHSGGTATCTEQAICEICHANYDEVAPHIPNADDGDCTTAINCFVCGTETTPASKHSYTNDCDDSCNNIGCEHVRKAPHVPSADDGNCTTAINCFVCGTETTPASKHSYTNYCDDSCNNTGCEHIRKAPHVPSADDGDCTTPITCSVCGTITTSAEDHHSGGSATCTKKAECVVCGIEYGDYADHTPNQDDGDCTTVINCSVCGEITTEVKTHVFDNACDTDCNNDGCEYNRVITHWPSEDDNDCTTPIKCSICGVITTPANANHIGGTATCTKQAKCTVCGKEYGELANHTPNGDDNDCSTAITCSVCGNITTEAREHDFGSNAEYDYNDDGHWKICANAGCSVTNRTISTQPHDYGEWYIPSHDNSIHVKECVCEKIVWEKHVPVEDDNDCTTPVLCSICNLTAIKTQKHDFKTDYENDGTYHWHVCGNSGCLSTDTKKLHSYGAWSTDEVNTSLHKHTCTVCGYTESVAHDFAGGSYVSNDSQHWKKCKYCNAQDVNNKETHNGTVATCTQKSRCLICNTEYGSIDPNNHNYEFNYNDVSHYDECTRCHKIINSSKHTIDYRVDVEQIVGTYDYRHSFTEFCTVCEYSKVLSTENIHMHENSEAYGNVPATCEFSGYQAGLRCTECDHVYFEPTLIPAKGHKMLRGSWVDRKDPTCTEDGYVAHGKCEWCTCNLDIEGKEIKPEDFTLEKNDHLLKRTTDGSVIEINLDACYNLSYYPEFAPNCIGAPPTDETTGRSWFYCDTCGDTVFVQVIGHYSAMMHDETNHWLQCTVPNCTEQKEVQVHQFSQKTCSVCGYKKLYSDGLEYTLSDDETYYVLSGIGTCEDTDIQIPSTYLGKPIQVIGFGAFSEQVYIKSVSFGNNITTVEMEAFNGCTNLETVYFSNSVKSIWDSTFASCNNLSAIYFTGSLTEWFDISVDFMFISGGGSAEANRNRIGALYNVEELYVNGELIQDVILPESVVSVVPDWFRGYKGLRSVTWTSQSASVSPYAFEGCTNLETLILGDKVSYFASNALNNCTNFHFNEYNNGYYIGSTTNEYAVLYSIKSKDITEFIMNTDTVVIATDAFKDYTALVTLDLGDSITSIGAKTFSECSSLKTVTLGANIKSTGGLAFSGCNIETVYFKGTLAEWNNIEFTYYYSEGGVRPYYDNSCNPASNAKEFYISGTLLTRLTIQEGTTNVSIYDNCIYSGIKEIVIPTGVSAIDDSLWARCSQLEKVFFGGTAEEWNNICSYLFDGGYISSSVGDSFLMSPLVPGPIATVYFYSDSEPTQSGNYWHYSDSEISIWEPYFSKGLEMTLVGNSYKVSGIGTCVDTNIVIPAEYNGRSVTSIDSNAFQDCTSITGVELPESITSIDLYAFQNCTGLEKIFIPKNVRSIQNRAFYGCTNLAEVIFDNNATVSMFGSYCFANCTSLKNFKIPASVTSIGVKAFDGSSNIITVVEGVHYVDDWVVDCDNTVLTITLIDGTVGISEQALTNKGFTQITLCDSLLYINRSALSNADIETLTIPKNVIVIDYFAFSGCQSLTTVVFTDESKLQTIGGLAFEECRNLSSVSPIPKSVINISSYFSPWAGCCSLKSLVVDENNPNYCVVDNVLYNKDMTELIHFCERDSLTMFTIPSTVQEIEGYAFYGSNTLMGVIIPNGVKRIENFTFYNCSQLLSITIPESVTYICGTNGAFNGCNKLIEVVNNSSLEITVGTTLIAKNAIEVHQGSSNLEWQGDYIFYSHKGIHYLVAYIGNAETPILPNSYNGEEYVIHSYAFYNCSTIKNLSIPNTVTSIGKYAFRQCDLAVLNFEENSVLTTIGYGAFSSFTTCSAICIPKSVTTIGELAFCNMRLKSLQFEEGSELVSIGNDAFWLASITEIVMPKNITTIGEEAFYYSKIKEIYYCGNINDWQNVTIGTGNNSLSTATVYYYSETSPTEEGNYWYYSNGIPTAWVKE